MIAVHQKACDIIGNRIDESDTLTLTLTLTVVTYKIDLPLQCDYPLFLKIEYVFTARDKWNHKLHQYALREKMIFKRKTKIGMVGMIPLTINILIFRENEISYNSIFLS